MKQASVVLLVSCIAAACGRSDQVRSRGAEAAQPSRGQIRTSAERLWKLGNADDVYDVSPDGHYAGYIDWNTGNLMLRDLRSGEVRDATKKGTYQQSEDEAESALFSPDGKYIAYEWWSSKGKNDELRVLSLDDGSVRTVLSVDTASSVWPDAWMPDGRSIAIELDSARQRKFALVRLAGGRPRVVKKVGIFRLGGDIRISPDGRWLAYGASTIADDHRRYIRIINLANGAETTAVTEAQDKDDAVIGWADNNRLLFASERSGTPGVWSIAIQDGRAQGEPQLVHPDMWHMTPIRYTSNGSLFYVVHSGDRDVYTAAFDAETGGLLSQPVSATGQPGEDYNQPFWSPDGQSYGFLTTHHGSVNSVTLTIRSADAVEQQDYTPRVFGPQLPVWTPNKSTVMLTGQDTRGQSNLYKFDLKTGKAVPMVTNAATVPAFSRDGRLMYYVPQPWRYVDTLFISHVMVRDLNTGRDRQLYTAPRGWRVQTHSVTNDGKTVILVAINTGKRIGPSRAKAVWALSTETGSVTVLSKGIAMDSVTERIRPVGFSPDQKYEILMKDNFNNTSQPFTLWRAPLNGGPVEKLAAAPPELKDIASVASWLSPDGRRIIFTAGSISSELWVLKNAGVR